MIKIKVINGREWFYNLDDAYLSLPEHKLVEDIMFTIKESSLDASELIEEIENE